MGRAPQQITSLTHMATQSMPTVSCLSSKKASLILVPTPSVPETSTGSFMPVRLGASRPPKPPIPPSTSEVWVRLTESFISSTDSYPAVTSTPACL